MLATCECPLRLTLIVLRNTVTPVIRIELFGGLRVRLEDRVITRFSTRKTAALLAHLAYFLEREHPREVLIGLFWPESDLPAGRKSLSVALSAIRRELEGGGGPIPIVRSDHFHVSLNPAAITTDVREFEQALARAGRSMGTPDELPALLQAAELYQGQLLPGMYEDWIPREQERLAGRLEEALGRLIVAYRERGDFSGALVPARRLVELDPLREEAHREMMRLFATTGRVADALRQFHELEQVLRRELGSLPAPSTRALLAEITRGEPAAPTVPSTMPMAPVGAAVAGETPAFPGKRRAEEVGAGGTPVLPGGPEPAPRREPVRVLAVRPAARLPARWSVFVGRDQEQRWLDDVLQPGTSRLVTLTGPGGSGKTRLALEVAARLQTAYAGGVWFIPLADLAEPRSIVHRVAQTLGLPLSPGEDPLPRVVEALTAPATEGGVSGPGLLVLDNFEHLAAEGAPLLHCLLEQAPHLTCLVTSRQRLNLAGEREFPVPALQTPGPEDGPAALLTCESVQLFLDRARGVRPGFQVTTRNAPAIRALCERLEGIPLALELAAARAQVLTPAQMVEQLEHRFEFLVSHRRDAEARHRSLSAAVEWSYQLLPADLQRFFAALSVFRGGWTLDAATAVTAPLLGQGANADSSTKQRFSSEVLEALARLCECSLIVAEEVDGDMRYRMLETLREYAESRLTAEDTERLRRSHLDWCQAQVDAVAAIPHGMSESDGLELLDREGENLWAALGWCCSPGGDVEGGLRLAACLGVYWYTRGDIQRARDLLLVLLTSPEATAPTRWRAGALNAAGVMVTCQGDDLKAIPLFEEALALGQQLGHRGITTHALSRLARIAHRRGEFARSRTLFEEALEIKRAAGDVAGFASILASLGHIARAQGEFTRARHFYDEALAFARKTRDIRCTAMALDCLARCDRDEGNLEHSRARHEEALTIRNHVGDKPGRAISLGNLALVAITEGNLDLADTYLRESLGIMHELGDRSGIASCLWAQGRVAAARREWDAADSLYRQSLELRSELDHLGETIESLEGLAEVAVVRGQSARAVHLLSAAEAIAGRLGIVLTPEYQRHHETAMEACRTMLPAVEYEQARLAGGRLDLPAAIALARSF